MKKKTTALARTRTTKRTITKPPRDASVIPFQRGPDGALLLSEEQRFQGASQLALDKKTSERLRAPFAPECYDILPSGECYVSHVYVRRRLNDELGIGQWALVPVSNPIVHDEKIVVAQYYFYVRGHFIRSVFGEAEYVKSNARMSYATALEAAYSNAVTRACKELGIASECWDKRWTEQWKRVNAVRVWVRNKRDGENKVCYRRRDADPLPFETGFVKSREGEEVVDAEPSGKVPSGGTNEVISRKQHDDLIDLARRHGVAPSALEKIVGSETGQTQIDRITTAQYQKVWAIVERIAVKGGRG